MRPTWLRVVCLVALPAACVWASGCVISELDTTDLQLTCEDGGCPGGDGVDPVEGEGEGEGGVAEGGEGECEGGSPDCQDPPVEGEGEGEPGAPRAVALQIKPVDDAAVAGEDLAFVVRSVGGIGQDAPSDLNVTLSLAEGPDGAELAGTTERALVEGVANFEGIVLTRAGAGYVLLATTEGLDPGRSDPFDVRPGPAVELRFTVEPPNGRPGQPLTPPLEVGVVDRLGNATSPDGNISVTLGLAEDPTELAVLSATPVGGAGPTFEFAGVQINRAGAGFHLSAHADGLADGRSRRFSVAEAGAPDLVLTMGASGGADAYTDLISDGDGGVIVTGAFTGDHLVEDQVLGSAGGTDIVLARFDADGGLVWARSFGGPGDDRGVAVSLAGLADGLRLAGLAAGGARFDNAIGQPTVIGDAGGRQVAFVASVNPDTGDLVLVQPITDVAVDLQDMACSVLAYCYLTGGFKDAVAVEGTFAEGEALAPLGGGRGDAFFLGFGPAGRLLWAHAGGSAANDEAGFAVSLDAVGRPVFVGAFSASAERPAAFGPRRTPARVTESQGFDVFSLKLGVDGEILTFNTFGSAGHDVPTAVVVTSAGVTVAGTTDSRMAIAPLDPLPNAGSDDGFVVSFGVDRIVSWGRTFGGDGFDDIRGIAAAPSEGGGAPDIIVTGGFVGEMDVGARVDGGQRVQTGGISTAGFLARLDGGTGQTRWATSFHGLRSSQPLALSTSDSVAHVAMLADSAVTLGRDEPPNPEEGRAGEQTVAGGGAPDAILADFDLANGLYRRGEGHGGGGADDGYFGVSALADGGFLVSGGFSGNAFIGLDAAGDPVTLSTTGVRDGVLVNHGPDGHARWARQAAGPGDSLIVQAFAGVDGAIATAGVSTGAVTLGLGEAAGGGLAGETVVGASGQLSLLVTGHDEDGRFRWHRTATGQGFLFPLQISPSAAGTQLLVSGYVDGDGLFRFGSDLQSITALADQSVGYAARYELADGALSSLLEVRADPGGVRVTGSTQTPDGDTLIAGVFDGLLRLVDPPVEARGEDGAGFLARLAPDGQVRWISIMSVEGGLDFGRLRYTEIDGRPAVFLTGFVNDYGGAAQFGPPRDERDPLDVGVGGFLARVDAESGDLVWLQMLATGARGVEIIGLDASGDSVAIAGTFRRSVILAGEQREGAGTEGERELVPRGNDDLFTALYRSRDGVMQWVRQVGGTSEVEALSVAILQDGSVVAAGRFQGVATVVGAGELPDREIDAREGEEGLIVRWLP